MTKDHNFSQIAPVGVVDQHTSQLLVDQSFRAIRVAIDMLDGRLGVPIGAIIPWCPPEGCVIPDDIPDHFGLADGVGNRSGSGFNMLDRYLEFGLLCDVRKAEQTGAGGGLDIVLETEIQATCTGAALAHSHGVSGCSVTLCDSGGTCTIFPLCTSQTTASESSHNHVIAATCHTHNISSPTHSHEMTHVRRVVLLPIERLS